MGQVCTVCRHPDRQLIDEALASGEAGAAVARERHLSAAAVRRHRAAHLPAALMKGAETAAVDEGARLLAKVDALVGRLESLLSRADQRDDFRAAAGLSRELRAGLETLLRVQGILRDGPVVNVVLNQQIVELKTIVLQSLAPFPEAREALFHALEAVNP